MPVRTADVTFCLGAFVSDMSDESLRYASVKDSVVDLVARSRNSTVASAEEHVRPTTIVFDRGEGAGRVALFQWRRALKHATTPDDKSHVIRLCDDIAPDRTCARRVRALRPRCGVADARALAVKPAREDSNAGTCSHARVAAHPRDAAAAAAAAAAAVAASASAATVTVSPRS